MYGPASCRTRTLPSLLLLGLCAGGALAAGPGFPQVPAGLGAPPALVVDAIVVDKKGAPVDDLRAREFEVVVDGKRRTGVALAKNLRGPAAGAVAARRPLAPGELGPVLEPNRIIAVVVDQASFLPGDQDRARLLAESCVSLFGLSEPITIVPLPIRRDAPPSFDRVAMRPVLAGLRPLRNVDPAAAPPPAADPEQEATVTADPATAKGGGQAAAAIPTLEGMMPGPAVRESLSPDTLRAHAQATLAGLVEVFQALQPVPGAKTVLFLSAGLVAAEARAELRDAATAAAWAQVRLYALQVPTPAAEFADRGSADLQALAADTGGSLVQLSRKPEQALQRFVAELSSSYLLLLSPIPGDLEPVPHEVRVTSSRRGVTLRAGRFVMPGRLTAAQLAPVLAPPPAPPPAPAPAAGARAGTAPQSRDAALDLVLARVGLYVLEFGRELSSVVAEEEYTQEVRGGVAETTTLTGTAADSTRAPQTRRLVSDFLLVKVAGLQGWLPFRDVFEVDGVPVRDRQDRLVKLFVDASPEKVVENARTIWRESARYNIGGVERDLNVPTLPLWFLEPSNQPRFTFKKAGDETLAGASAVVIDYRETGRPTFIRTPAGTDVPASGSIWVEPVSGRVLKTILKASMATITVTYAPRPEMPGLWPQARMEERYAVGSRRISGVATYSHFRRFQVTTKEQITPPKIKHP